MNPVWHELLANMAIVALFISIWSNIPLSETAYPLVLRQIVFGSILGVGAIGVMMLPIELEKGFYFDLRRTVISVSGLYGGPVAGLITAACATLYRLQVGGAGVAAGLMGIGSSALVGIATFYLLRGSRPGALTIVGFSVMVAVTGALGVFTLPPEAWLSVTTKMFLPGILISLITTTMAAVAVSNELRRRKTMRVNHIFRSAIECLPDPLSVRNLKGRVVVANPAAVGSEVDFSDGDKGFGAEEKAVLQSGLATMVETELTIDSTERWFSTRLAPLRARDGAISGLIVHRRDVTEQKLLGSALRESEKKANAALTNMADGLVMFDENLNVVFCNEKYREMFPLTADLRIAGSSASSILHASIARGELIGIPSEVVVDWVKGAVSQLRDGGTVQFPLWDGRWIESRTSPAPDGTCFVVCSDITKAKQDEQKLRALNDRLAELAETDGLTGLLNRRAFDAAIQDELRQPGNKPLSLLLLDVDRFKAFNDTYGHISGDACLISIASCLKSFGSAGTNRVARYGGEELAVIMPDCTEDAAIALAHELRHRVRSLDIKHIASEKGVVTMSIGVATLMRRSGEADATTLIMRAYEALYSAKATGRDLVRAWSPSKPQLIVSG